VGVGVGVGVGDPPGVGVGVGVGVGEADIVKLPTHAVPSAARLGIPTFGATGSCFFWYSNTAEIIETKAKTTVATTTITGLGLGNLGRFKLFFGLMTLICGFGSMFLWVNRRCYY